MVSGIPPMGITQNERFFELLHCSSRCARCCPPRYRNTKASQKETFQQYLPANLVLTSRYGCILHFHSPYTIHASNCIPMNRCTQRGLHFCRTYMVSISHAIVPAFSQHTTFCDIRHVDKLCTSRLCGPPENSLLLN
jgi:hypothetical protein